MEVIITIFKEQLESNPELKAQLASLSLEVKEISAAMLYIPREDSLIEFVSLLNGFKISFGAHAPDDDILDIIRWNGWSRTGSKE